MGGPPARSRARRVHRRSHHPAPGAAGWFASHLHARGTAAGDQRARRVAYSRRRRTRNRPVHYSRDGHGAPTAQVVSSGGPTMPIVTVANLSKTYASGFQALNNINLTIRRGEI